MGYLQIIAKHSKLKIVVETGDSNCHNQQTIKIPSKSNMDSPGAGGRRRGTTRVSAEDQALDQIAKEVSD